MPYNNNSSYNHIFKPASNLLADRLTNRLKNKDSSGDTSPAPQGNYTKLHRLDKSAGSIESSLTESHLTASVFPLSEAADVNITNMSSDEESPKRHRKSSRHNSNDSSDDESPKEQRKSSRRNSSVDSEGRKKKKSSKREGDKKKKKYDSDDEDKKQSEPETRSSKMKRARDVSFSGSTIKRIEKKESSYNDSSGSLLDKPALKPGKYSRSVDFEGSNNASNSSNKLTRKISFGEVVAEATNSNPVPQSQGDSAAERRKAMFTRAVCDMRDSLEPTVNGSNKSDNNAPSHPTRRATDPDIFKKEDCTAFPPLQRRASAPQLVKRKSISQLETNDSIMTTSKSLLGLSNANLQRRASMSQDDQIYVPPKTRHASIIQAMAHLMAGRITDLVLWTYGASFAKVMFFFLAVYVFNILFWAFIIIWADTTGASGFSCLYGEGGDYYTTLERYELGFELSWSTFTTVGYGAISPPGDDTKCYALRLVCALVAFIGVLFGSTTAAIMYSKLMRLLAKAQITFSSTLCVQFGKGNEGSTVRFGQLNFRASVAAVKLDTVNLLNDSDDDEKPAGSEEGYPVIEFRMVNDRANREKSEIWDATISGVVQVLKETPKDGEAAKASSKVTGGESTLDLEKVVYYPITLTPDSHPHFSRIWYARHVLNAESPLLKREFRDVIAQNGKWDEDFNSWRDIRDCLNPFVSLRITLSGTSAVSAATVYGEHVYEFDDVCVGWRFANMVYEDKQSLRRWWQGLFGKGGDKKSEHPDLATKVDLALLHDIVPQPGGGHEPLGDDHSVHSMRKAVLGR